MRKEITMCMKASYRGFLSLEVDSSAREEGLVTTFMVFNYQDRGHSRIPDEAFLKL